METPFDNDIKKLELESILMAQKHSQMVCKTDILKLKKRIQENEVTITQLDKEIIKTQSQIDELNKNKAV